MLHDVIMPALGMAQETGIIVSWHKRPGDSVMPDDILMEVETDKAVMEVEAGYKGIITELCAEVDKDVKVGSIVAVIDGEGTIEKVMTVEKSLLVDTVKEAMPMATEIGETVGVNPAEVAVSSVTATPSITDTDRVFASPKAQYQAHVKGIDLRSLAHQGVPQPIHAADLGLYRQPGALPPAGGRAVLRGKINSSVVNEFISWAREATDGALDSSGIWSVFCAAAFRQSAIHAGEYDITVKVSPYSAGFTPEIYQNPDLPGLGNVQAIATSSVPQVHLHDLTDTALCEYSPVSLDAPLCVTLTRDDEINYMFSVYFNDSDQELGVAVAFVEAVINISNEPRGLLC